MSTEWIKKTCKICGRKFKYPVKVMVPETCHRPECITENAKRKNNENNS